MTELLQGATMMGCLAVAVFFARFWRETDDRFFAFLALAFATFGFNRLMLVVVDGDEAQSVVYVARLIAFVLVIGAIVDKNRAASATG